MATMLEIDEATKNQMLSELGTQLATYSIGFLKFFEAPDGIDGEPKGTGTLVSIGSARGILTAAHVADAVANQEIGVVRVGLRRQLQKLKLNLSLATPYKLSSDIIDAKSPEERSPDLGLPAVARR